MSPPRDEAGAAGGATPDDANAQPSDQTPAKKPVDGDPSDLRGESQPGADHPVQPVLPGLEILPLVPGRATPTEDRTELPDEPGVDPLWRHHGEALASLRAMTGIPFTTDDLRADGLGEPAHVNHWGLLMGSMARAGIVRAIGAGRSPRASRAGGLRTVWIGTDAIERGAA